jgi:glutathione S-transferase
LAGDEISIADLFAVSEIFYAKPCQIDFSSFERVQAWFEKVMSIPEVAEVHKAAADRFSE